MALLGNVLTLSDRIKRQDPDGEIASIVNLLEQTNDVLKDMHMEEGNRTTGHQYTQVTSLPTPGFRKYNEGAVVDKMTTAQVTETCGILEVWNRIDEKLVELEANAAAFRLSEAMGALEGMAQVQAKEVFYGNPGGSDLSVAAGTTLPVEGYKGLAPRYNSLSGNVSDNVLNGGGTGGADYSSIWLVGWGPRTVFGFYPKGTPVGLVHKDWGKRPYNTTTGVSSATLAVYEDQFQWNMGLALKDWRYAVRICNIDISALVAKSSAAPIIDLMIKAIHRIPNVAASNLVFYANRTCFQMLDIYAKDETTGAFNTTVQAASGGASGVMPQNTQPVRLFRGIPVRLTDALSETEQEVS